jgi:hypothetical protein
LVGEGESGWVGSKVAGEILGVCTERMADLARRGALPVYQKRPGQRGSPLYFRVSDVERLAAREERGRRKERLAQGVTRVGGVRGVEGVMGVMGVMGVTGVMGVMGVNKGSRDEHEDDDEDDSKRRRRRFIPEWEEKGLAEYDPLQASPLTERDYGEFYTVRQVAIMLGVTTGRVRELRKSGRLTGHQRPARYWNHKWRGREPTKGTSRWWFFRKEDVHKLQSDPGYCKGRRAFEKSLTAEGKEARFMKKFPTEEEIWEYWKANQFGRGPRGVLGYTGWRWD